MYATFGESFAAGAGKALASPARAKVAIREKETIYKDDEEKNIIKRSDK